MKCIAWCVQCLTFLCVVIIIRNCSSAQLGKFASFPDELNSDRSGLSTMNEKAQGRGFIALSITCLIILSSYFGLEFYLLLEILREVGLDYGMRSIGFIRNLVKYIGRHICRRETSIYRNRIISPPARHSSMRQVNCKYHDNLHQLCATI